MRTQYKCSYCKESFYLPVARRDDRCPYCGTVYNSEAAKDLTYASAQQEQLCNAVDNMIRNVFNVSYAEQVKPWEDSGCEITLPDVNFRIQPHEKGWQLREPSEEHGQVVWGYVDHESDIPGILKALANQILMLKLNALVG